MKLKVSCKKCSKEFFTWSCRIKKGWGKYCNIKCKNKDQIGKETWNKGLKGLQSWHNISGLYRKGYKLSEGHKKKIGLANSISLKGKKLPQEVIEKIRIGNTGKKMTNSAKLKLSILHKGKLNPQWKGGVSIENSKIRFSHDYKVWRRKVLKRDNYMCVDCNSRGIKLNADHIKSFSKYPKLRLDVSNGRTLCLNCHKKKHKGRNLKGDMLQYINKQISGKEVADQ